MNDSVVILSIASAITVAIPVLFAALGEIVANRCGVMNLGVEGMMLMGAVVRILGGHRDRKLDYRHARWGCSRSQPRTGARRACCFASG